MKRRVFLLLHDVSQLLSRVSSGQQRSVLTFVAPFVDKGGQMERVIICNFILLMLIYFWLSILNKRWILGKRCIIEKIKINIIEKVIINSEINIIRGPRSISSKMSSGRSNPFPWESGATSRGTRGARSSAASTRGARSSAASTP